jgi:hypothetical protein
LPFQIEATIDNPAMKAKQIVLFIFMLLLFGTMVWFMDVIFIQNLARQHRAESFPGVKGEIVSGEVIKRTGSKGRIYYRVAFVYRYQVNGQTYEGRRFRYDGHPSFSNYSDAEQVVALHPTGSVAEVHYNPTNPADAVLSPGIDIEDVSFLFLAGAMNLLVFSFLVKLGWQINWLRRPRLIAGGMKIITDRMTTRVRLPRYQPGTLALWTVGGLALIAGFALKHVARAYPPVPSGIYTLAIIMVAGLAVYFWFRQKMESGLQDLVIDEGARMIELPLTYRRRERKPLPITEVTEVTLVKVAHQGRYGTTYTYAPTLRLRSGATERLTDLGKERAESFASWLRERLGLPEAMTMPEPR